MAQVLLDYFKQLIFKIFSEILTQREIKYSVKHLLHKIEALFVLFESLDHVLTEALKNIKDTVMSLFPKVGEKGLNKYVNTKGRNLGISSK